MDRFEKILIWLTHLGTGLGAFFLAGIMILIVVSIITRLFGSVVPGSYEMIELMIVVTVSFSLAYTGLKQGHVIVNVVISRFPERLQNIIAVFTCFISLCFWGALAWAAYQIAIEKGILEVTDYFLIPYIPFRFIFTIGLLLLSFTFLTEMLKSIKRGLDK